MKLFVFLVLLPVAVFAQSPRVRELTIINTTRDLTLRNGGTNEAVLVLNGDSFSDFTGNAILFYWTNSVVATNTTSVLSAPNGRWIARRVSAEPEPFLHTDDRLVSWVESTAFSITNAVATLSGVVTNANLRWPDGSGGTYTALVVNPTFGSVDSFQFTHTISGKTITQPLVSRNVLGVVTNKPLMTVVPPGDLFQYPFTNFIGGAGYYANLAGLAAATNTFTLVFIKADTNGVPGWWVRGIGTGTVDGANYAVDAAGVQVKRVL